MPIIDLPLEQLHRYQGRNPRPADFDDYWSIALAELDATASNAVLERSCVINPRQAECHDLWFEGVGGAALHAKYLRPSGPGPYPLVLFFHGYSASSGDWFDKLSWVREGFCVAALDCRGQGGLSHDSGRAAGMTLRGHIVRGLSDPDPQKLTFRNIFLDTVQLARTVMRFPEVDADRVGCYGGSQGGGLALACGALEPRIRKVASTHPFLCDYQRTWEMDQAKDAYEELRYYFRYFDPRHERKSEIFEKLGYIDCQHLAPRIQAPVLMVTGLMDTICPPSTQFAAYNKINSPKQVVIYPDFAHEAMPGASDLIFNFLQDL